MSVMYGIFAMPLIILQWVIDPLYKLILNGPNLGDAEFCPVQIGFAVALGVTSLSIAYTAVCGCRRLDEETKSEIQGIKYDLAQKFKRTFFMVSNECLKPEEGR